FSTSLRDYAKAVSAAEAGRQDFALAFTLNNMATLYLRMGQPENVIRVTHAALDGPARKTDRLLRAKLRSHLADAEIELGHIAEAQPVYREAINELLALKEFDGAVTALGGVGLDLLWADRPVEAEAVLSEGQRLVEAHHLRPSENILSARARLKSLQGD